MSILLDEKDFKNLILIGDKVLIKPKTPSTKTKSGLYLPPTVSENEKVLLGYVVKVGPGFPIPSVNDDDEPWKERSEEPKYVALQPRRAIRRFTSKRVIDIEFNDEV